MLLRVSSGDGEHPQRNVLAVDRHVHFERERESRAVQRDGEHRVHPEQSGVGAEVDGFVDGVLPEIGGFCVCRRHLF